MQMCVERRSMRFNPCKELFWTDRSLRFGANGFIWW
jgi:hypothetical protein